MFFAGSIFNGISPKTMLPFWQVLLLIAFTSVIQALLFSVVLPRVKGVTFTMVTLGLASVFHIIVMSSDMINLTGADVGLQGMPTPAFIDPASQRLRFFVIALVLLVVTYRPKVCRIANRQDLSPFVRMNRGAMLGITQLLQGDCAADLLVYRFGCGRLARAYQPIISPVSPTSAIPSQPC